MTVGHPLDMLAPDEVTRAVELLRSKGHLGEDATIVHAVLDEPDKDMVLGFKAGDPVDRAVRVLAAPGPGLQRTG